EDAELVDEEQREHQDQAGEQVPRVVLDLQLHSTVLPRWQPSARRDSSRPQGCGGRRSPPQRPRNRERGPARWVCPPVGGRFSGGSFASSLAIASPSSTFMQVVSGAEPKRPSIPPRARW